MAHRDAARAKNQKEVAGAARNRAGPDLQHLL